MPIKILFCATYPDQPIGYGNIAHKISNYLASDENIDFYYFGFSNVEISRTNRFIHPKIKFIDCIAEETKIGSKLIFGTEIIEKFVNDIKPDVLFIYNDAIVIYRLLFQLQNYRKTNDLKVILYLDLVYPYEKYDLISFIHDQSDMIFVFSDYWKTNLIDMGFNKDKIKIFYHGLNQDIKKIDKKEARKFINVNDDDFIVLNINRNSYRKALDISISSFLKFLKKNNLNKRIKLFLNCYLHVESGYTIHELLRIESLKLKLDYDYIVNNHILIPGNNCGQVSDEYIYNLYSACDIGINTCVGEGFGLCNMEQASVGIPQIISAVGGLIDIFKNTSAKLIEPVISLAICNHLDCHNGDMLICKSDDFAKELDYYFHNEENRIEDGKQLEKYIREKYVWDDLLSKFKLEFFESLL
jgi:glycosyltransferase involved in cell wall biosynthesis